MQVCVCVCVYVSVCVCLSVCTTHVTCIHQATMTQLFMRMCFSNAVMCLSLHTTQKAVALLQKRAKGDGWFLVRPNSRRPGYYALTLVYNSMPYHYEIVCEVCQRTTLSSLSDIVLLYQTCYDMLAVVFSMMCH